MGGDVEDRKHSFENGDVFKGLMMISEEGYLPISGVMAYKSSTVFAVYSGTFLDREFHGSGKLTFRNGDVFDGVFVHGHICGKGTFTSTATGTVFRGVFGRRRTRKDGKAPELHDTMVYKGFESAKGLRGLKLLEEHEIDAASAEQPPRSPSSPSSPPLLSLPSPPLSAAVAQQPLSPSPPPAAGGSPFAHTRLLTGKGEIVYANGHRWNGRFSDGVPFTADGGGSLWIPIKPHVDDDPYVGLLEDTYTGEMSGFGVPHGRGELCCARGGSFVGEFCNGLPHGLCKATYANGDGYDGILVAGERTGRGKLTRANGDVYEGEFVDGTFHGRGRYTIAAEETVFDGTYVHGVRQGRGRLVAQSGSVFDGYFVDGARHGLGISLSPSGERQEAWYTRDRLVGVPRIFFACHRALPAKVAYRVAGASLRAFCHVRVVDDDGEEATAGGAGAGAAAGGGLRPIRLRLHFVPAWLAHKRCRPEPEPTPLPVATSVGVVATDAGACVALALVVRPQPRPARARTHLLVCMEPPSGAYLGGGVGVGGAGADEDGADNPPPTPIDMPRLEPRVRLDLYALRADRWADEPPVACAAQIHVPPLLEWHEPLSLRGRADQ